MKYIIFYLFYIISIDCQLTLTNATNNFQKKQWIKEGKGNNDCRIIDSYVRIMQNYSLILSLAGDCNELQNNQKYCNITIRNKNNDLPSRLLITTNDLRTVDESRAGNFYSVLYSGKAPWVKLTEAYILNCGSIQNTSFDGTVSLNWSKYSIMDVHWKVKQKILLFSIVICSKIYVDQTWTDEKTILLIEWIEWNKHLGGKIQIHLYIKIILDLEVLKILNAYIETFVIVLHDWTNEINDRLWEYGKYFLLYI
jgi:hypothetical protein